MSANRLLVEDDRDLGAAIRLVHEDEDWRVEHVDGSRPARAMAGATATARWVRLRPMAPLRPTLPRPRTGNAHTA